MPGNYVNSAGGEFSIASDTLKVELVEGNNYVIHRRTGYNLITDGKVGARKFEAEQWSCAYSIATKTLTELMKGKVITFYPDSGSLKVGRRVYQKIN
jgi:spore germination protein YaaH